MRNADAMQKPKIFISHIHEEQSLAIFLKEQLLGMFLGGVDFFISSDRNVVRGGALWLDEIRQALKDSAVVLALISPRSIARTWINFESGAGWVQTRLIPICHSGLKP